MYPKPLHQIIQDYKKREEQGRKVQRYYSPTSKNIVKPFKKKSDDEKSKR